MRTAFTHQLIHSLTHQLINPSTHQPIRCAALLPRVSPPLLLHWASDLLLELITLSGRNPHVSGFYKLISIVCAAANGAAFFGTSPEIHSDIHSNLDCSAASTVAMDVGEVGEVGEVGLTSAARERCSPHQLINSSTHQLINSSTHQLINSSTHQRINSSTHQLINSSTHQLINSSAHQLISSSAR